MAFGATFFPQQCELFVGWDWFYLGNRLQETLPNQFFREHRTVMVDRVVQWLTEKALYTAVPLCSGTRQFMIY